MTLARVTVTAPARWWEPLLVATALSRPSAGDRISSDTPVCAERPPPAPPPGAGPWVLGWVLDQGCRPVAEALVALQFGEIELLARTEADGAYALAVEPGIYQAELIVEGPWQALDADGQKVASVEVSLDGGVPRRLDFFIERDER